MHKQCHVDHYFHYFHKLWLLLSKAMCNLLRMSKVHILLYCVQNTMEWPINITSCCGTCTCLYFEFGRAECSAPSFYIYQFGNHTESLWLNIDHNKLLLEQAGTRYCKGKLYYKLQISQVQEHSITFVTKL